MRAQSPDEPTPSDRRRRNPARGCCLAPATGLRAATAGRARAPGFVPHELIVKLDGQRAAQHGASCRAGSACARPSRRCARDPAVDYAAPNYIATASVTPDSPPREIPNDPGPITGPPARPGAGSRNSGTSCPGKGPATPLLPISPGGIDAVGAWENLAAVGRPGAAGITVAVLDTGIAYRARGRRFRRSPDFTAEPVRHGL